MNINGLTIDLEAAVSILEIAAKIGSRIYEAIESHGQYSDAQKADLIARVKATRAAVAADHQRTLPPDAAPTPPVG